MANPALESAHAWAIRAHENKPLPTCGRQRHVEALEALQARANIIHCFAKPNALTERIMRFVVNRGGLPDGFKGGGMTSNLDDEALRGRFNHLADFHNFAKFGSPHVYGSVGLRTKNLHISAALP